MSEEIEVQQDEIQEIKSRLDQMGVKYHHNAKVDTLRALLAKSLKGDSVDEETSELSVAQVRANLMADANRLIRCRITCMNPNKRDWTGEIFTAGNSFTGSIKKFVPYNCETLSHTIFLRFCWMLCVNVNICRLVKSNLSLELSKNLTSYLNFRL